MGSPRNKGRWPPAADRKLLKWCPALPFSTAVRAMKGHERVKARGEGEWAWLGRLRKKVCVYYKF